MEEVIISEELDHYHYGNWGTIIRLTKLNPCAHWVQQTELKAHKSNPYQIIVTPIV